MAKTAQASTLAAPAAQFGRIAQLLESGKLGTVAAIAGELGIEIGPKTAIRWSLVGRRGVQLPTIKVAGKRLTTRAALVWWLERTAGEPDVAAAAPAGIDADAADQVLSAHGLGRAGRRAGGA